MSTPTSSCQLRRHVTSTSLTSTNQPQRQAAEATEGGHTHTRCFDIGHHWSPRVLTSGHGMNSGLLSMSQRHVVTIIRGKEKFLP